MLPGKSFAQGVEENLKALRVGRGQDQESASAIHRANRSVEVNEFTNELRGDRWSHTWGSPTRPGTVDPTEASFVGEHDPQPTTVFGRGPFGFSYRLCEALFYSCPVPRCLGRDERGVASACANRGG